jgi:hypothetical protein
MNWRGVPSSLEGEPLALTRERCLPPDVGRLLPHLPLLLGVDAADRVGRPEGGGPEQEEVFRVHLDGISEGLGLDCGEVLHGTGHDAGVGKVMSIVDEGKRRKTTFRRGGRRWNKDTGWT